MSLLTNLLLLLVGSRLLGQLFVKYKQPAIVGEMLAGVILGPAVLDVVSGSAAMSGISELAIFLVVLSAGLEMEFKDIIDVMRGKGLIIATLGFVVPFISGIFLGLAFDFDVIPTVFIGLCMSLTALPVAVRMLESFGILNSDIARYSVATAIVSDVTAFLILGVILGLPQGGSFATVAQSVAITGGKLAVLAAFIWTVNRILRMASETGFPIQKIPERLIMIFGHDALFGIVVAFVLIFGSMSELLGFHFVIGAFFGALLISKELFLASRYNELQRTISSITSGFLAPLFFAYIGLEFNVGKIDSVAFVIALIVVSMATKFGAGWLGGKLAGLRPVDAAGIGITLNGRGVMDLVVASIAFHRQIIGQGLFSTLIILGVFATMITPLMFRHFIQPRLPVSAMNKK